MRTAVIFFPFDLFGSPGTADGVRLLADEFREILADNARERVATRARAYSGKLRVRELSFETLEDYQGWRDLGRSIIRQAFDKGEQLFWITGNHLGALPVYEELGSDSLVIQFDAHLDIHHFRDCTREPSHGNFLRHCSGPLPRIINIGHRELLLRARDITQFYTATFAADRLACDELPALNAVREACQTAGRVFIDIDCDVFDPAFFPAVSQPVPFGMNPPLLLQFLEVAWSSKVAGLSLSEFDPARDRNDQSLATLVWLLEYLLLRQYEAADKIT